jgi:hypothetical protein
MAIAPFLTQEGVRRPYATTAEVKINVATSAVDFTKLVKGGSTDDQLLVLTDMLALASEKVDDYCVGPLGTMGGSINTENGEYTIGRDGLIAIKPEFWPVLAVNTFNYGLQLGDQTSVPCTAQNVWIERDSFKITQGIGNGLSIGSLSQVLGGFRAQSRLFCTWTYTNGFFNAFLTAAAAAGASEIEVDNTIGLFIGETVPIYDGLQLENVTVADTWDGVSLSVPLAAELLYDHAAGVRYSAIPRQITQAAIHFVVGQMKERGVGGFVLQEQGQSKAKTPSTSGGHREEDGHGYDLLDSFRKTWGRA